MSDFNTFLYEQMAHNKDLESIWSARNRLLGFPQHGAKTFCEMNLSNEEREQLFLVMSHPSFDPAMDNIVRYYTTKNRLSRRWAAYRAKRHARVIEKYRRGL